MSIFKKHGRSLAIGVVILSALFLSACTDTTPTAQTQLQAVSETIYKNGNEAASKDYAAQIHGPTAEVQNVKARNIRLLNANKIGYVYQFTNDGKLLGFWTIRGKMSSTASQLTNSQNIAWGSSTSGSAVTDSIGDDATYGNEECQNQIGVFFFQTGNDALTEICGGIIDYSDAPMGLTSQPLIVVNGSQHVTTTIPKGGTTIK